MPLFDGPIVTLLRKHKVIRKLAFVGGVLVGIYLLGASQGWWERFLF
jgi:hypothetical protein